LQAERKIWNDERMDEFATRTEANFAEVRGEFKEVREDFTSVRTEIRQQGAQLRTEMNERFAGIERRFDTLTGGMIAGFVSLIVIHFVG